jgi:hypothetical protein
MKAKTFALAAAAAALLIAPVACTSGSSTDKAQMDSQQVTEKYQAASQKAVPYGQPTNWLERTELNKHLARQDDPNAIRYIVLMTQQGQIIGQYTLKGMVFDPNSQLTNDEQIVSGWSGGSSSTYYNQVVKAPGDNGTWGPEAGCAAFFTQQDVEVQVPCGVWWVEADAPQNFTSTPLLTIAANATPSTHAGGK